MSLASPTALVGDNGGVLFGGGGTSYDPLEPDTDPAVVPLSAGTTDSSGSARTFAEPSGGSGSYTLSVSIVQDVGSGATLAGDNSSGWYATSLEDGDIVRIVGTWEDDETEQEVANEFVVYVAPATGAAGGGLEEIARLTFAGADTGALSGSGTITDDGGGTNVVDYQVFVQTGSASRTVEITADGLRNQANGGNSVGGIALDLAGVLALADWGRDLVIVDVVYHSLSANGVTSQNHIVALGDVNNSISNDPNRGLMLTQNGASDVDLRAREYVTGASTAKVEDLGTSWPSDGHGLLEVTGSRVQVAWEAAGALADRNTWTVGSAGGSAESVDGSGPTAPWLWLLLAINPQAGGDVDTTISEIVFYRATQGAT